ncbi:MULTISPECIES: potassium transporter Kup [Dyella]|uniref:Probable potassium transport system protein Kup n=2 Tax=Dyella TaxID=231454 RepID=A0A4R0YJN5_9GAMM|nr:MULTISPECIES: potassium transporter Kup [Dyella]TBR37331.1 potassium transporter Kup [Dyella terrae]TCI08690.1 potassium transporter Kup [Dyella soli]
MHGSVDNETRRRLAALALGAIGVVYGDIGTSPLYTLQATLNHDGNGVPTSESVFGVLSLIFWAQIIVVSLKYVVFIMRADNKGEGGIMALLALALRSARGDARMRWILAILGIFGAALFYGDGVITPAISVLSAVEGVKVAAPNLPHWVVPSTAVVILFLLFSLQRHGTERVGRLFGPVMVIWFIVIAALGVRQIAHNPHVLFALNPWYAVKFFDSHGMQAFIALGGVVLALTGAEALYADMGHFGKKPIRLAWFSFVLPALVLNYFGQGALLLDHPEAIDNPFFKLVPSALIYPMVGLATLATVIASQAVISGAFSMTREAMSLGYSMRMPVVHTSREMSGQIFVPWVNAFLLTMVLIAVLGFRSSENLSAAYGIAVTGTMTTTTILALVVARYQWHWSRLTVLFAGMLLLTIDLSFLGANLIKIEYGGWFPLVLGVGVFIVMTTWRRGRELVVREIKQSGLALEPFIENVGDHPPLRVPGTAVFLTANQHAVPHALLHNLKHNKVLHERNVLLTVEMLETPVADADERIQITSMGGEFYGMELRYGFAEDPNIPKALSQCSRSGLPFDMMDTTFFLSRETIIADARRPGMALWRDKLFAFMARNALPATAFFQIPGNRLIELGAQVEI